jgi:hypothetical protein
MARKSTTPKVSPPALVTLKVQLPAETVKALRLEGLERGCTVSQVITDLVGSSPTRLVLTRRSRGDSGTPGPSVPPVPSAPERPAGSLGIVGLERESA